MGIEYESPAARMVCQNVSSQCVYQKPVNQLPVTILRLIVTKLLSDATGLCKKSRSVLQKCNTEARLGTARSDAVHLPGCPIHLHAKLLNRHPAQPGQIGGGIHHSPGRVRLPPEGRRGQIGSIRLHQNELIW